MKNFIKNNWLLILTIIYVISPFDLIPEAIPLVGNIFGNIDDATLVLIQGIISYKKRNLPLKQ